MIAPSRLMHCSSARSALVARFVLSPAWNGAWPKRPVRGSGACFYPLGHVGPPATSR